MFAPKYIAVLRTAMNFFVKPKVFLAGGRMPEEKPVVQQMYNLIKWLIPQIAKLPRSHKFTLGDRITNLALDTLDLLIQAVYTRRMSVALSVAQLSTNVERSDTCPIATQR